MIAATAVEPEPEINKELITKASEKLVNHDNRLRKSNIFYF